MCPVPIELQQAAADALLSYGDMPVDVTEQLAGYIDGKWASPLLPWPTLPYPMDKQSDMRSVPPWKWLLNHTPHGFVTSKSLVKLYYESKLT